MQLETLRLYCDVVRLHSYSRGAAANGVSQSAASQSIQKLERDLGAVLIDRAQRPFVVTGRGQLFYQSCQDLLGLWEKTRAEVAAGSRAIDGQVRVAAIYSVGLHEVNRYVQEFQAAYPKADVRLDCLHPHKVVEAVVSGEADIGIMSYPPRDRGLSVLPLPPEPMVLVCHPDHPLARRKTIRPGELSGEAFVAFESELMIRKAIDRMLRRRGVQVDVVMEFDNIETIKQAIAVAAGVSILPLTAVASEVEAGTLAVTTIAIRNLVRPVGMIQRRHQPTTATVERFIEFVQTAAIG